MGARYIIDGNASGAVRAVGELQKALEKADAEAEGSTKTLRQLRAEAERIKEAVDPQEKYNRKVKELAEHVRGNRISLDQAKLAAVGYRRELDGVDSSGARAFGAAALSSIKSYATGIASIGTAMAIARAEIQGIVDTGQRINATQVAAAVAEGKLRRTVAGESTREQIVADAKRIAVDNALPVAGVLDAVTAAYGATSNAELSLSTINASARKTRDVNLLAADAEGVGGIVLASRIKDVIEASGFLEQVLQASNITQEKAPIQLGKVLGAYVNPIAQGSEAVGGALLSNIAQSSLDKEGERARTATIEFVKRSEDWFRKNRKKFGLAVDAIDSVDERFDLLMDDANMKMTEQFIREVPFGAASGGGVAITFLDPTVRAKTRADRAAFASRELRLAAEADVAGFVGQGGLQRTKRADDVIESVAESLALAGDSPISTKSRETLINLVGRARGSYTIGRAAVFKETGLETTHSEAIALLENERARASQPLANAYRSAFGADMDAQARLLASMDEMVRQLKEINGKGKSKSKAREE